ncbi:MAG: FAD-binding oxidoreductase [Bacteroidia bacterium]|nr:FAD-binding oxidoreductase [Bacteroidia bacterium]
MNDNPHIAILGSGLAGTFLAARLCLEGNEVTLIDDFHPESASGVAAGMFNVITGKFGAKSWMADELLASLQAFLEIPAFHSLSQHIRWKEIYRPFKAVREYNKWQSRQHDPEYAHLVSFTETPIFPTQIENPHGGIQIHACGWIAIQAFLENLRGILVQNMQMRFVQEKIDYHQIDIHRKEIRLSSDILKFDRIAFCEGVRIRENPWFRGIPIIPNKGEILLLRVEDLDLPFILSGRAYLIPHGNQEYIAGSTYHDEFRDPFPSSEGLAEIEENIRSVLKIPYTILDHRAGIRPATPDRRPIAGSHPDFPWIHIFTGFGTKGVLLAPHFSTLLAREINGEKHLLPDTVRPARF